MSFYSSEKARKPSRLPLFAVCVVAAFSFVGSFGLLKGLSLFMRIRVTDEEEELGLDASQHGEEAYGDGLLNEG